MGNEKVKMTATRSRSEHLNASSNKDDADEEAIEKQKIPFQYLCLAISGPI